jgi:hypothetical protein
MEGVDDDNLPPMRSVTSCTFGRALHWITNASSRSRIVSSLSGKSPMNAIPKSSTP